MGWTDKLANVWQHGEPSTYQLYHGEDPLTGLTHSMGFNDAPGAPTNPGGDVGAARPETAYGLQQIPGTNFSYNPATGQYYQSSTIDPNTGQVVDLGATQVAQAPNLAQQGSGAAIQQNAFLAQQADVLNRMAATRAGQVALQRDYQDVIRGAGPSVAAAQLYSGMGHIAQDQAAQAAGANGQNAFAARRAAAQATARAQGDLSGQMALLRAQEVAAGRAGLASLYGNEASADTAANNAAIGAALGYGQLGEKSEADRQMANLKAAEINQDAAKENNKVKMSFLAGAGDTGVGLAKIFG